MASKGWLVNVSVEHVSASVGVGVIALQDLEIGTVVLRESPLFVAASIIDDESLIDAFQACSNETLEKICSLCGEGLKGKIRTNGVALCSEGAVGGVFEHFSRLNHACSSNCSFNFLETEMEVKTIRFVKFGEQLTINYRPNDHLSSFERKISLLKRFGFLCECEMCVKELREDDASGEVVGYSM